MRKRVSFGLLLLFFCGSAYALKPICHWLSGAVLACERDPECSLETYLDLMGIMYREGCWD